VVSVRGIYYFSFWPKEKWRKTLGYNNPYSFSIGFNIFMSDTNSFSEGKIMAKDS
jgi:hypothetical protein